MTCEQVLVPIPDFLFQNGGVYRFDPTHPEYGIDEQGRRCLSLDSCIVPAIQVLWQAGITTISCCCGHGEANFGVIAIDIHRKEISV